MDGFTDGILSPRACADAAAILVGQSVGQSVGDVRRDAHAVGLLDALGYRSGPDPEAPDTAAAANRVALLSLAAQLRLLFRIAPPDAPNLAFLGGELDAGPAEGVDGPPETISLAGAGPTLNEAFERCVGEGAEFLSQKALGADIVCRACASEAAHGLGRGALSDLLAMLARDFDAAVAEIDWVSGRCLTGADPIRLPADLCLRRPDSESGGPARVCVGTGCAGGPTEEDATLAGVLELVERDAAALWWSGGRPAKPISLEVGAAAGAGALLRQVRAGAATRNSWLLDITTDLGIPCVASVSLTSEGDGFACGLGAGLTIGPAIRSAILEMCQMELGHRIIALKRRQRGDEALNRHDLAHLDRARSIDADTAIIQPKGLPNDWRALSEDSQDPERSFQHVLQRFEGLGINIYVVNLTRDWLGIPVSKVIATGLQPYPSEVETSRLGNTIERYGVGNKSAGRVALL